MLPTLDSTTPYAKSSEDFDKLSDSSLVIKYDTIKYRGQEVTFLSDPCGNQCVAKWNDELIDLGLNNIYYKEDVCRYIDYKLDFISDFRDCPNFVGAKLEYFHNGDFRDIRLSYNGRIIKVFLVAGEVNETWLISESKHILRTSGLLDEIDQILVR